MSLGIILMHLCAWCIGWHLPGAQPNMPLQLPTESRWHATGSTYHIIPLHGLSCRLNTKRAVCKLKGLCSSEIDGFHREPLSLVGTFGASSLFWLRGISSGALPPTVGQSFLLAGSFLPNVDGLASAAIWANCWVGDNSSDLPTSPNFSGSSTLLSNSVLGLFLLLALGVHQHWRFLLCMYLCPGSNLEGPFTFPHPWYFLGSGHTGIWKKVSQSEVRAALQESHDIHCKLISTRVSTVYLVALLFLQK